MDTTVTAGLHTPTFGPPYEHAIPSKDPSSEAEELEPSTRKSERRFSRAMKSDAGFVGV